MKFKSKVDWWIHIAFAGMVLVTAWILVEFILSPGAVLGISAAVCGIPTALILPWWVNMYYNLDENELVIHLGGFGKGKKIPYSDITSIKETREPYSSEALSIDRIEIKFKAGKTRSYTDVVYISPKEKQEFLRLLEEKRRGNENMEQYNFEFKENRLTGPSFNITFENEIEKVIFHNEYYFVLLQYSSGNFEEDNVMFYDYNVYCVNKTGDVIWQVKVIRPYVEEVPAMRAFVEIRLPKDSAMKDEKKLKGDVLIGLTMNGNRFIINKKTGETIGELHTLR
ncbi:MAG: PH domain-containing protein [Oscillospiraceae bacterium]|nr:PH domain-containing protein [Oscillospiraceae bacterium]